MNNEDKGQLCRNLTDSRVLVTGGAGFIGSRLTKRLLEDGNEVLILDNSAISDRSDVPGNAELIEGDLTDSDVVNEAIDSEIDGVSHLLPVKPSTTRNPANSSKRTQR